MSYFTQAQAAHWMWVPALDEFFQVNLNPLVLPADWDPQGHMKHDGEWHAVARLNHEVVEWEGYGVPLYEGDLERQEWEANHR